MAEPLDRLLSAGEIRALLVELGEELAQAGEAGELFIVGGAALALGYEAREATRDVDAVFEPKSTIATSARRVAERHGLRDDWLNDAMKGFLHGDDDDRRLAIDHPALRVYVAGPRYLLAMKLLAARIERDADDIALLLDLSGITQADDALDVVEAAYGRQRLSPRTALIVEAILADDP